jgi:hypothetical protein|tara:strand:+ start:1292 stop:1570 length:279 start_codon:yes stop_codon:yes gene_type:complete
MIVINNNPEKQVPDKMIWYASHVFSLNKNGEYDTLKCRYQGEEKTYTQIELMKRVDEFSKPTESVFEDCAQIDAKEGINITKEDLVDSYNKE